MATFNLTDNQAEAILNMRLRSLRKLEEIELRAEHKELTDETGHLEALLGSDKRQWGEITKQIKALKKDYGARHRDRPPPHRPRRRARRRCPEEAPSAFIEREPITVILSEKGWIRAAQGPHRRRRREGLQGRRPAEAVDQGRDHRQAAAALDRRQGLHARRRSAARRPRPGRAGAADGRHGGGARHRRSLRLRPGIKRVIASRAGNGFIVAEDELIANTRKGKQVLNVSGTDEAA